MQTLTSNAIAWAAFQLQGGWKNILLTAGGFAATIVVAVVLVSQFVTIPLGVAMYNVLLAMLALQGALLLLFAPSRIQTFVRRDVISGMIESHRLMPLPPANAVLGYVLGPAAQPLVLALATLVIGAFVAQAAAVALPRWLVANFLLLELAVVGWVVMGTAALHNAQAAFLALFFVLPTAVNSDAAHALPGAILLLPPLTGRTIFDMGGQLQPVHGAAFLLHAVIVTVFVRAAARKYVRSDATALTPLMGLCLVACWSAASIVAMRFWPDVRPTAFRWRVSDIGGATVACTLVAGALLAMAPLTALARPPLDRSARRPLTRVLTSLAILPAVVVVALAPAAFGPQLENLPRARAVAYSAVAFGCAAAAFCLIARALYLHGWRAWFVLVLWLMLTTLGPIAYDAAQHALSGETMEFVPGPISQASPLGTLHTVWIRDTAPAPAALLGQVAFVVVAAAMLAASYAVHRWRVARLAVDVQSIAA